MAAISRYSVGAKSDSAIKRTLETRSRTMRLQSLIKATKPLPKSGAYPFIVINRSVYFNGNCDQCRPHCGAVCCSGYGFVGLTEEEAKSGRYGYRQVTEGCECNTCKRMLELGLQYVLLKHPDGNCIYLDGTRGCGIYESRPETCKKYSCVNIPFNLSPTR